MKDFGKRIEEKIKEDEWEKENVQISKFNPYYMGYCQRQMFLSKLGIKKFSRKVLGAMQSGTIIHEWMADDSKDLMFEQHVEGDYGDIHMSGRYDAADDEAVYDFKSQNSLKHVKSSPKESHVKQLECYMRMSGREKGKIVYIDKNYLYSKEHTVYSNDERWDKMLEKARGVKGAFEALRNKNNNNDIVLEEEADIPFSKCDCFYCQNEQLKEFPYSMPTDDKYE